MKRLAIVLVCLLAACGSETPERAQNHVSGAALKAHVEYLASDALEGRLPGTDGYDKAAIYVAEQFQVAGLEPAGINGTYFQPIVFKRMTIMAETARLILRGAGQPLQLQYVDSYYFVLNPQVPVLDITAPLAFAGYGIQAPEFGLTSYDGIDAAGKVIVAMSGAPDGLVPEVGAVLSSLKRKAADAQAAGAVGLVIVYAKEGASYPSRATQAKDGQPHWLMPDGTPHSDFGALKMVARIAPNKGGLLFEGAKFSYDALRDMAGKAMALPSFDLPISVTGTYAVEETVTVSSNVLARLPAMPAEGSALEEPAQAVMLVSHLDHLGRHKPVDGDDLYNGAVDNALGVASIIETAKALKALETPRPRDIYVAALTAEESGLQGSQYLARYLPMPAGTLTAVLNIDMPVAFYPFAAVQPSGETHSNLGAFAAQAAARYGLKREDDPMPEEAIFVRSDHYSFVERGIPALYLNIGVATPEGSGVDGFAQLDDFLVRHYHMPSDEVTLPIDWDAAALFADVHVELLRDLANTNETIAWRAGSFFNQPRAQP